MKKLITILVIAAMLLSADVSYGGKPGGGDIDKGHHNDITVKNYGMQNSSATYNDNSINDSIVNTNTNTAEGGKGGIGIGIGIGGEGGKGGKGGNANVDIENTNRNVNRNTNRNNIDVDASSEQQQGQIQGQKQGQGQGQSQVNEGNTTNVETNIDNSMIIPAPILPIPGFATPSGISGGVWTSSPFDLQKANFTVSELTRLANPSKALGLLWPEWDKDFKIEIACWDKKKPQKSIKVCLVNQITIRSSIVENYTKMGEAHAKAIKLHKSERQVMAALCVHAAKQGAKVVVIKSFSNPVTKADTAVLGGAGVGATGNGDVINSAGGFGWATAEKVYRSYVVAELYR